MAYTTIDKPTDYFETKLYTGNASTNNITGLNFQPDWVWLKSRSFAQNHENYDSVRGATKRLYNNLNNAEDSNSSGLTGFNSDGFTLGSSNAVNKSGDTFVSWNWLAGGSASSNSNGSITSSVSANTTAGFSIVSYTGNGSDGATVGHGLGVNPSAILFKRRNGTSDWSFMGQNIGTAFSSYLRLQLTNAFATNSGILQTSGSSTFTIGTSSRVNASSATMIAYCFAEKKGYSKIGSYKGNGNADGTFVYTGFKPAWVLCKLSSGAGYGWTLFDNKRAGYNQDNYTLQPDGNGAENTGGGNGRIDILSNGFKQRSTDAGVNANGSTYVFMAFAENPFVTSTGIPATAR